MLTQGNALEFLKLQFTTSVYLPITLSPPSLLLSQSPSVLPCPLCISLPSSLQAVCSISGFSASSGPNSGPRYSHFPFTRHTGRCSVWTAPTAAPAHHRCSHQHGTSDCPLCGRQQPVRSYYAVPVVRVCSISVTLDSRQCVM